MGSEKVSVQCAFCEYAASDEDALLKHALAEHAEKLWREQPQGGATPAQTEGGEKPPNCSPLCDSEDHHVDCPQYKWLVEQENKRCAVCGCPLAESRDSGCVRGDCSMRPVPDYAHNPEKAIRENNFKPKSEPSSPPATAGTDDGNLKAAAAARQREGTRLLSVSEIAELRTAGTAREFWPEWGKTQTASHVTHELYMDFADEHGDQRARQANDTIVSLNIAIENLKATLKLTDESRERAEKALRELQERVRVAVDRIEGPGGALASLKSSEGANG